MSLSITNVLCNRRFDAGLLDSDISDAEIDALNNAPQLRVISGSLFPDEFRIGMQLRPGVNSNAALFSLGREH